MANAINIIINGIDNASGALGRVGDSLTNMGSKLTSVGGSLTAATLPLAILGTVGIKTAADFETSMNILVVAARSSGESMEDLSAAALAVGVAFGTLQGWIIQSFRIPAFLVTLAGMFFARGMAFMVSPRSLEIADPFYADFADRGIPLGPGLLLTMGPLLFVLLLVIAMVLAHGTRFGRHVYALGGNEASATLMGLPVAATRVATYALCGGCAALGGVISTLALSSGDPTRGNGLELDAIAAAVIGGTVLTGGRGWLLGTFLGVLILGTIKTILDFNGSLDPAWLRIASGGLLLAFILLQKLLASRSGGN
jgi:simple sugar transport system permease protein